MYSKPIRTWILFKREFNSYFAVPATYIYTIIFLISCGVVTFYFGNFFARGEADLFAFFAFLPWIYTIFIPAITMQLWADEHNHNSIEILFTLPIKTSDVVLAKFLAAWLFSIIALALTFPLWISVNYLGSADNGVIIANYLSAILMAGGFVAIGAAISAFTKHTILAFVGSAVTSLAFTMCGSGKILENLAAWLPDSIFSNLDNFSILSNFDAINGGLIKSTSIFYFATLIIFWLLVNLIVIEAKKANQ